MSGISRRDLSWKLTSAATMIFVDGLLAGCKTTAGASLTRSDQDGAVPPEGLFKILNKGSMLDHVAAIDANPDIYPDILLKGANGQFVISGSSMPELKKAALRNFLVLYRTKANSFAMMDALMQAGHSVFALAGATTGIKEIPPGVLNPPVLFLSHQAVTEEALAPGLVESGQLVYGLEAYQREMKLLLGHFLLCDNDVSRHDEEKKLLAQCVRPPRDFFRYLDSAARDLVEKGIANDSLDVISSLARWLPVRAMKKIVGLPDDPAMSDQELYDTTAALFSNCILNQSGDPVIAKAGREAGGRFLVYLAGLVSRYVQEKRYDDTMLGRLAQAYAENPDHAAFKADDPPPGSPLDGRLSGAHYRMAAMVAGVMIPSLVAPEEAIGRVLNEMLRPENAAVLPQAIRAAKESGAAAMTAFTREGMRLSPQTEIIPRVLRAPRTVGGVSLRPGNVIFVCLYAAMRDPKVVESPDLFVLNRPEHAYLQFGHERNQCLGRHLATSLTDAALAAVFQRAGQSLAADGSLMFEGPFAKSFKVRFL